MDKPIQKYLVVARFREDTGWTDRLEGWNIITVQKEDNGMPGDMPNVGREPSSFCHAIAERYDSITPTDVWAFVQGRPFDHCPDVIERMNAYKSSFQWLGEPGKSTLSNGAPDHPGLPVAEKYKEWLDREFIGSIDFAPGGQHIVEGQNILARPKDFYEFLKDDFAVGENAWVAERLWKEIYT